jgi:hypothetical protein
MKSPKPNKHRSKTHKPGFIRSRGFITIASLVVISVLTYLGSTWGREYYILKMGQTCSERMWLIERGKEKYREATGRKTGKIDTYAELLPYLEFTGFPVCPWGGEFEHKLDLDKKVESPFNGKPDYEPKVTPDGVNIMTNGYNDLGEIPEGVTLIDFLHKKTTNWGKSDSKKKAPKKDNIFK